ncbi:MAG TPA: DNA topoisomerase (ATP-hydrolyzing) [Gemmataceae bacterium]|nr:DNA topoisomerase (ATP-hydrolyzing) [Gemmataceae bacterium]
MPENIQPVSISEETRHRYLTYALSVITSRALPDVRDGLKPVQRRILYTMYHDLGLRADSKPVKCARIVGEVTGKYHPHGNDPVYDALVRMAQDFMMREPLVVGQGNFGSVDGDPPAAYRYTEAKISVPCERLMGELRQRTVDRKPSYDNVTEEPLVLPAQFPNLLVNGSAGIAVGMATNIPPHNLGEVVKAAVHLIDHPNATTAQLLDHVKGPDFPLGGRVITDRRTLRKTYEDGTGSIKMQGEWKLEEQGRRRQIILTSIPYGVNKGSLESVIGEIIESRKLPQLLSLTNETNEKVGLRIALDIKADADPEMVMAYLYKHTALQENFAVNLTCLVPGEDGQLRPERVGLKDMLRHFLDFRFATVRRRFEYELEQLKKRIHILDGFRIIFNGLDKALKLIRESDGKPDAAEKLIKAFKLDQEQTDAILDAQLYRIAQLEIKKILTELREKKAEAQRIEEILGSKRKLWGVVKTELSEIGEKFGDRRRTRMAGGDDMPEFDPEAYIVKENANVVLTRDGWVKRVGRLQSVEGTRVREGDAVIAVAPGNTLDHVIFFADDGAAYTMRINEVPASSGYGEPVAKFFRLGDQAHIVNAVSTDERFTPPDGRARNGEPPGPYVLVVTSEGQTLRTPLAPFRTESNKLGRRYARLNEGDRVVLAAVLRGDEQSIFLASADGHVIHFPIDEINILAGVGKGVIGIKLADGDTCLGGAVISPRNDRLALETSTGKTLEFRGDKYEKVSRAGKGFEAVKRSTFVRVVPPPIELVDWEQLEGDGKEANGKRRGLFE